MNESECGAGNGNPFGSHEPLFFDSLRSLSFGFMVAQDKLLIPLPSHTSNPPDEPLARLSNLCGAPNLMLLELRCSRCSQLEPAFTKPPQPLFMPDKRLPKELQALIRKQKLNNPEPVSRWERLKTNMSFLAFSPETIPTYDKESGMMVRTRVKDRDRWKMQEILEKHEENSRTPESRSIRVMFVEPDGSEKEADDGK
jgi:hypothetical protein